MILKFKKIHHNAVAPQRMTPGAAGFDLTCTSIDAEDKWVTYSTGIAVEIPEGYAGFLYPRSSIYKTGLYQTNSVGVIDSDYRGEIKFIFKSFGSFPILYNVGDRIGQLVIMKVPLVQLAEVSQLSKTKRGDGGHGSTGN